MTYGVKYQFSIEATNGNEVDIFLLQRDYSGQKHIRALGRAPILKRERNGCILGTSLEIFAECRVDGEFAELYTSDAYEYKVEVYKRQILQWTGFVSPELYAEPDIAPPYDVQIIATDGLGELKNYDFAAYVRPKSYQAYIESMLEHTGLALPVEIVSDLQYYDEGWSDANGLEAIVADLSHKAGENCYDVLQAMLTSVNACITQQDGIWAVIRESDLYSWRDTVGYVEFGSMNSCDWWPVGNLNADVIPAKKYLSLTSENHYKPTVLRNSAMTSDEGWAKEYNAAYDETEKAYILPDGGSNIRQTVNFFTEVGYRLFLHISARNVGNAAESQKLGVMIKINGRMYQAGDEFWLKELADYEGRYAWSNTEGYLEFELPDPSDSETRADASDIEVVIPLYKYDSRSYAYATSLEVTIFNISGVHDIYLYECSLQQYEQPLGHKIEAVISNGARESMSDIELALNDGTYAQPAADIFRNAIPIAYHSEAIIQKWKTSAAGEGSYLSVMAKDYAMQVALPRMRYRGKLNVPSMAMPVVPLLFFRDGTYYFLNTYAYDLLNDELEVELISIPNANVAIESETITEIASPGSASGTGVGGSGVAGGGGDGGTSITIDTEMSDSSRNAVENRVIKAYVDGNVAMLQEEIDTKAEARLVYYDYYNSLTDEQKAYNAETYQIVKNKKQVLLLGAYTMGTSLEPMLYYGNSGDAVVMVNNLIDGNDIYISLVTLKADGTTSILNSVVPLTPDTQMSNVSNNAVANRVIKEYVDGIILETHARLEEVLQAHLPSDTDADILTIVNTPDAIDDIARQRLYQLIGYTEGGEIPTDSKWFIDSNGFHYVINAMDSGNGTPVIMILGNEGYTIIFPDNTKQNELIADKTTLADVKAYTDGKFFSQAQFDPAKTHDYVKHYIHYDDEAPKTLEIGVDLIINDDIANAAEDDLDNGVFNNGLVTALGVKQYVENKIEEGGGGATIPNISFEIDITTMELIMTYDEATGSSVDFSVDESGNLIATLI